MKGKWQVECFDCGAKNSFNDEYDIRMAKWKVIAWTMPSSHPRVICDKCLNKEPEKKKK